MTETTYTHTVDKDVLFKLMREHVQTSQKANDLEWEAALTEDEAKVAELNAQELEAATRLGNLGFEIANLLLTRELRTEFMTTYQESQVEA